MKLQTPAVFALGAAGYAALELLWRGRTHWTMALTGGAVLVGLRQLRRRVHEESPLSRCLCGAACITAAEYVVGCTVNRHFGCAWDYSHEFGNVQGQICPKYAAVGAALRTDHAAEIRQKCAPPLQYGFQWLIIVVNYAKETHHADRSHAGNSRICSAAMRRTDGFFCLHRNRA
ncbi:MAG: putative ABC transporter permease [Butyricicoccaceae bacterium]